MTTDPSFGENSLITSLEQPLVPRLVLHREKTNLESRQLVWLGEPAVSLKELRKIIDYIKLYSNVEECRQYIERTQDSITFLICTEELGHSIISQIHHLQNIKRIFIFCCKQKEIVVKQPMILTNYLKVKSIYTDLNQLLKDLTLAVLELKYERLHEEHVEFEARKDQSTDDCDSSWAGLTDFWIHLPYPDNCCQRFIENLKIYYENDESKLKMVRDFERDYTKENVIQWYTRETFLYSSLNRALRQRNIEFLFLYGFFLRDLHQQLEREHHNQQNTLKTFTCYRGQCISRTEIETLQNRYPPFESSVIVNNSLLSTSLDRRLASIYLNNRLDPFDDIQSVLFEIEVNMKIKTRPFANITHLSQFDSESEILFMVGTLFKIRENGVYYSKNECIWIIKLELFQSDTDNVGYEDDLKSSNPRVNLRRCISLLPRTIKNMCNTTINDLQILFRQLLDMFSSESEWIAAIQSHTLAIFQCFILRKPTLALSNFEHAITLWSSSKDDEELNRFNQIGQIHSDIAMCYRVHIRNLNITMQHINLAITNYEKALLNSIFTNNEKLRLYQQLGNLYEHKMDIVKDGTGKTDAGILCIKYRELFAGEIPTQNILNEIARVYKAIHAYDNAIATYEKGLQQLTNKELTQNTILDFIAIYGKLCKIYLKHKPDYHLALKYQLLHHEYGEKVEIENDKSGIDSRKQILAEHHSRLGDIYKYLDEYDLSYGNFFMALDIYNGMTHFDVQQQIADTKAKIMELNQLLNLTSDKHD